MVRVFKTRWFARFARKEDISDGTLANAVQEAERGLNDGDLGGNLIKKRVARTGEGKRGGFRTIIVYRVGSRAIFVYGFPKSAKANLNGVELDTWQKLARFYLNFTDVSIAKVLSAGELEEVHYNDEEISE